MTNVLQEPTKDRNEYFAYVVLCAFNCMFKPESFILEEITDIDINHLKIKYEDLKSLLYIFFTRENTKMVDFIDNKYLFSHGGITKFCLTYYYENNKSIKNKLKMHIQPVYNYNLFNFVNQKNEDTEINIVSTKLDEKNEDTKINIDSTNLDEKKNTYYINTFVKNCNNQFKTSIENVCNNHDFCGIISDKVQLDYIFLLTAATEMSSAFKPFWPSWKELDDSVKYPSNKIPNNYLSPIGPGLYNGMGMKGFSQNEEINFKSENPIFQICGHKPLGLLLVT